MTATSCTIRPYVESDAEAIADLMNAVDAKHGAEAGWTGGEIAQLHQGLGARPGNRLPAGRDARW